MDIQGIYAALAATNMAASERFCAILFGREPDDRPMEELIQWRDVAGANIQVFLDRKNAGSRMCTIAVPDINHIADRNAVALHTELDGEPTSWAGQRRHRLEIP
jgi:hypothetical protein